MNFDNNELASGMFGDWIGIKDLRFWKGCEWIGRKKKRWMGGNWEELNWKDFIEGRWMAAGLLSV